MVVATEVVAKAAARAAAAATVSRSPPVAAE
jgi:hypothetical protein